MSRKFPANVQEQVRQRANFLCEYCHANERWQCVRFTIDHITPTSEGGEDNIENLALAYYHCNRHKSNKQTAVDNETDETVLIFNPRRHKWSEHFVWSNEGLRIIPLTANGRVTVDLLEFNRE